MMADLTFYISIHLIIFFSVLYISKKINLYDYPKKGKIHKYKVINSGGIMILIFMLYLISNKEINAGFEKIIVVSSLILIIGFTDDLIKLSPGFKLLLIAFPCFYLISEGYLLTNIGEYSKINVIELGKFSFIFTLMCAGLLINACNYIDGIDGLLLSKTVIALFYFIYLLEDDPMIMILVYFQIPLILNLLSNLLSAKSGFKVFLGNNGSLFIGFNLSFLIIYLYIEKNIHPSYLIWAIWYPVYDFLCVNIFRIYNKRSLLKRSSVDHFHYKSLNFFKKNKFKTLIFLTILNIIIMCKGYLITKYIGEIYSSLFFIVLFLIFAYLRIFDKRKYVDA